MDTFGVGEDSGQPVMPDYLPPVKFTGAIDKVVIEVKPIETVAMRDQEEEDTQFAIRSD